MDARVDSLVDALSDAVEQLSNADRVGPAARKKLSGLIKYYRTKPHPFTSCVRDNTKRFGAERAKRVCAVLKDIMTGTTKWRKGSSKTSLSQDATCPIDLIDDEMFSLLEQIADTDYKALLGLEEAS